MMGAERRSEEEKTMTGAVADEIRGTENIAVLHTMT